MLSCFQLLLYRTLSALPSTCRVREDSWHSASRRCFFANSPTAANQEPFERAQRKN
ncbi:hypothetical protein PAMP_013914 [Pampus punctatissimus]